MTPRTLGIALHLSALLLFVVMDTLLKWLTATYAVPQLMWARFLFGLIFIGGGLFLLGGFRLPWRSRRPGLQAIRSLLLAISNLLFSTALVYLPLADVTAIGFASPLLTVALAAVWLRERVTRRRWLGVGIGFVGVLIALRPPFLTGEAMHPAAILPLGTALTFALYQILTRKLAAIDSPRTTMLHTSFAAAAVASAVLPWVWTWPTPGDWGLLVALGALGGIGHGLLVMAYARAPASLLAPLTYTQLVWAIAAGALVFGDWPDPTTLAGMAVIAAGGVLVAIPDRR